MSSEKFINQFIDHGRNNAINDFIHFYQLVDVLIIDDVQFFNRAEKSQDAFFAIFNHLHQSGKQLILTSDKPPKGPRRCAGTTAEPFSLGIERRSAGS